MYSLLQNNLYICSPLTKNLAMIEGQLQSTMANTQPQIAVKALTIVGKTKNSISIRWNKATDAETPQSQLLYTVTWCVAPYRWDNSVRKIGERKFDNSSYTITGLTPNTTYEIIVYVRDADGYENTYARTTVTTMPDSVPNTAPVISNKTVGFTKISANSVDILWQKATDKETAQKNLRYVVTWTPGPDYATSNRKQSAYMTDVNSYRITGLFPTELTSSGSTCTTDRPFLPTIHCMSPLPTRPLPTAMSIAMLQASRIS